MWQPCTVLDTLIFRNFIIDCFIALFIFHLVKTEREERETERDRERQRETERERDRKKVDHCATSDVLWYYGSPHMDTHQVSWGKQQGIKFTDVYHMTRFLAVLWILWFNIAHTYIHRERNKDTQQAKGPKGWHTHIYIYIHYDHLLCAHSSYLCYTEEMIPWYKQFTLQTFTVPLLFKNYWFVQVTHLLIRFNKTKFFPWNTKNTHKSGVNKQNTHAHLLRERVSS